MRREHVLTPDEARAEGYASIEEIADKLHIGESATRAAMKKLEQQGKVERVSVKTGRAIVSYWRVKD
ncbi:MAG: winged helix-turn-helix transcriptional regulator [Candidatus Methanomethylicaceae archaeon]